MIHQKCRYRHAIVLVDHAFAGDLSGLEGDPAAGKVFHQVTTDMRIGCELVMSAVPDG